MPANSTNMLIYKHPNSRKTRALLKDTKRKFNKNKHKINANIKLNLIGEKISWFRNEMPKEVPPTPTEMLQLIEKYLSRFDEELEQIRIKHSIGNRKNRQHASREDIINMTMKREREEFNTCGIEVPDLLDLAQFTLTKNWNGELRFLSNFKIKRYSRKYLEGQGAT